MRLVPVRCRMNDVIGHGMSCPCGTSVRAILPTHGVYLLPCSSLAMVTSQRRKCVVPWIWQFTHTPPVTVHSDGFLQPGVQAIRSLPLPLSSIVVMQRLTPACPTYQRHSLPSYKFGRPGTSPPSSRSTLCPSFCLSFFLAVAVGCLPLRPFFLPTLGFFS